MQKQPVTLTRICSIWAPGRGAISHFSESAGQCRRSNLPYPIITDWRELGNVLARPREGQVQRAGAETAVRDCFTRSSTFLWQAASGTLAAAVAARLGRRTVAWLALMWAVSAVTHPLLDMLTDGGSGVMVLFPFSTGRYFFPWRPIRVSPLTIARFFDRAGPILWSELPFCAAALAVGIAGLRWRKGE